LHKSNLPQVILCKRCSTEASRWDSRRSGLR